jgi:hypothetical protein
MTEATTCAIWQWIADMARDYAIICVLIIFMSLGAGL